jgi:hypothetical protein
MLRLLCLANGDNDLIDAWCNYYLDLGITSIHVIAHGGKEGNPRLYTLRKSLPIHIEEEYDGAYNTEMKRDLTNALIARFRGEWVVVVDSDEFVEFPIRRPSATIRWLELRGATALLAPMVQRVREDGALQSDPTIADPFSAFPMCMTDLYKQLGVSAASIRKYPLVFVDEKARLIEGGNHFPPNVGGRVLEATRGVTHHFKWRAPVIERLRRRAKSQHTWRHESVAYLDYLESHQWRLPTDGAFKGSRAELIRRGLLVTPTSARFWVRGVLTKMTSRW